MNTLDIVWMLFAICASVYQFRPWTEKELARTRNGTEVKPRRVLYPSVCSVCIHEHYVNGEPLQMMTGYEYEHEDVCEICGRQDHLAIVKIG